jgi:cardiolipin synthase
MFVIYLSGTAVLLLLGNRSPQSTFAWMLIFFTLPIIGLLIYIFFGRGWKAFSREDDLLRQAINIDDNDLLSRYREQQAAAIARLAEDEPVAYKRKLLNLVHRNANSSLTNRNQL